MHFGVGLPDRDAVLEPRDRLARDGAHSLMPGQAAALRWWAILPAAMSEKLAAVRRWVELYNERGDVTEFISLLHPAVELQTPGGPRLRGHDQARDWFDQEPKNVHSRIIPDRFVEEGDVVVALGRAEVRWIESGEIAHESESAAVFWFRDGKIARWQPFQTHDAALKAAGLAV